MRDDPLRLKDILTAVDHIQRHLGLGRSHFDKDEMVQVWIVHHLQLIGEAARSLSGECRAGMPDVPWPTIVGMRHALVHQYFQIDLDQVWDTANTDLPPLRDQIVAYIRREGIALP